METEMQSDLHVVQTVQAKACSLDNDTDSFKSALPA